MVNMMNRRMILFLVFLFLMCAAGAAFWYFFIRETDEMKVRRVLDQAVAAAEKKNEKEVFAEASDYRGLEKLFEEKVAVGGKNRYVNGELDRGELIRMFIAARKYMVSFHPAYYDPEITFPEKGRAAVTFTGYASGKSRLGGTFREAYECSAELRKDDDGEYRVNRIDFSPVAAMDP